VPLVWVVSPTLTIAPVAVKDAIKAVLSVPFGTATLMVLLVWSIVPVAGGLLKEKAVIASGVANITSVDISSVPLRYSAKTL